MWRIVLFFLLGTLLIVLASCQPTTVPEENPGSEEFEPRMNFDEVKTGVFQAGYIPKEYLESEKFVKFKSTSKLYGYLFILDLSPLAVDWVVFTKDGSVLKHKEGIELDGALDFDDDGVKDAVYQGTALIFTSEGSLALFSYDFPDGIFSITSEGGRVYKTDPVKFEPVVYNGEVPTATLVYYKAETLPEDVKENDVIFDVASYPYTGEIVIRKVLLIKDMGEVVRVESTPINMEDIIPALEVKFKGGMESAIPLNRDAETFLSTERADDHLLSYDGSKTLYSGKYATVTAHYGFNLDADFEMKLNYDWNDFDSQATVSMELSHDMILQLKSGADYKKSGASDPFFEPDFAFSVYGIPVVVSFPMYTGYDFDASGTADATVGYELSGRATLGESISGELSLSGIDVNYDSSFDATGSADLIGPEIEMKGKTSLRVYIGIDVKVSLAKMVYAQFIDHPYLKPEAEAYMHGDPYPDGKVDFDAAYGIDFSVKAGYDFKAKNGEKEKHLKDWEFGKFGPWTLGFPAPPSDLRAEFKAGEGIFLTWKDNSNYETGFILKKETKSGGSWTKSGEYTLTKNATSYTDADATSNIGYRYTLKAYSDWPTGDRFESQSVSYEITGVPPPTPTNPYVLPYSTGASLKPTLKWRCYDETGDTLSFDLYLGTTNPPPLYEENISAGNGPRYSYKLREKLLGNTDYYWKIVVHDSEGFTKESDVWIFRTIPDGKGYIYINAFDKDPTVFTLVTVKSIEGIKTVVDGIEYTTPATVLVDTGAHTITAQYYPNNRTRVNNQWLFKEWVSPKKQDDPEISISVSDDIDTWFVANLFYKVSVSVTGEGTAGVLTEGRNSFYEKGSEITLIATPYENSEFDGWYDSSGNLISPEQSIAVTVNSPSQFEAKFRASLVTISVTSTPIDGINVMVDENIHKTPFSIEIPKGSHSFKLIESTEEDIGNASTLHYLSTWKIGNMTYDDNPIQINVSTNIELTANLSIFYKIDATASPNDGGTITIDPAPNNGYLLRNTSLSVRAVPNDFYRFDRMTINEEDVGDDYWEGDLTSPMDITAYFEYTGP